MRILIDNKEVLCNYDFTITEEFKNTSSVILNNVYPREWENSKDYVSNFYFPPIYSICEIYDDEDNLVFSGVVKNTGDISLNPREPHFCNLEIVDFTTFLSESKTLDFVISNKTIYEAIEMVIEEISDYGFVLGEVELDSANEVIGAYSTLDKTAYDVFQYISDITGCRWFTKMVDKNTVEISFYDADKLPTGTEIEYTTNFFENYLIDDITYNIGSYDYRNRQVMTSDSVFANINYEENIITISYSNNYTLGETIGEIISINDGSNSYDFITKADEETGLTADFTYTPGSNVLSQNVSLSSGITLKITYTPLVKGREVINNATEINRISNSTGRKGIISRYEKRSDTTSSEELEAIGNSYLQYKGIPEITLSVSTRAFNWNLGEQVYFNAPLEEMKLNYLVRKIDINYIATTGDIFYTYEMISSYNDENAINYFDNQRYKKEGNIEKGSYIDRNIDIENTANIIFYDEYIKEITGAEAENTLDGSLDFTL